jgi:hypothetical protein
MPECGSESQLVKGIVGAPHTVHQLAGPVVQ